MLNFAPRFSTPSYSDDVDFSGFQGTYEAEEVEVDIGGITVLIPSIRFDVYGDESGLHYDEAVVTDWSGKATRVPLDTYGQCGAAWHVSEALCRWVDKRADKIERWAADQIA